MSEKKIYTKTGDTGITSLIGGTRVSKNDLRIEAYGTVDELNSFLGLLRTYIEKEDIQEEIIQIQYFLFDIGAFLATDSAKKEPLLSQELVRNQILVLENKIDVMQHQLPDLNKFIVPGGLNGVAMCHVCRTVCRRLERRLCDILKDSESEKLILKYVNRLSDFLFIFGRFISFSNGEEDFL